MAALLLKWQGMNRSLPLLNALAVAGLCCLSACSTASTDFALPAASAPLPRPPSVRVKAEQPEQLAQEKENDERAWQHLRTMLSATGNGSKLAPLDVMWEMTATPQQWVALRRKIENGARDIDPRHAAIINACNGVASGDFADVFRAACRQADGPRSLFCGLFAWATAGGKARLQGRGDLTLHFICGGLSEIFLGNGIEMGIAKERQDQASYGVFDLDDLAATAAGALWVQLAQDNPALLAAWADGKRTLSNIRPLRYGQNQTFDGAKLMAICRELYEDCKGEAALPETPEMLADFTTLAGEHKAPVKSSP